MTETYGRFPANPIDDGLLVRLKGKPAALAVFLVIARHVNDRYEAWPSVERLMKLTGMTRKGVQIGLRSLVKAEAISIKQGGGHGRSNFYQLLNSVQGYAVSNQEKAYTCSPKGVYPFPKERTGIRPNIRITEQEQQQTAADVDSPSPTPASQIRVALVEAGIGEPTQSELALDLAFVPQDTALKIIAAEISQAREHDKRTGAIVLNIRAAIKREKDRQQKEAERKRKAEAWDRLPESKKDDYRTKALKLWQNLSTIDQKTLDGICKQHLEQLDNIAWSPSSNPHVESGGTCAPNQIPCGCGLPAPELVGAS